MDKGTFEYMLNLIYPRKCPVCGNTLSPNEPWLCETCLENMPITEFLNYNFNPMEQLFAGKTEIERATGYFFYSRGSDYSRVIHSIKYYNHPKMATWLAERYAKEVKESTFFNDIDYILPVPLHWIKRAKRGYNQSEYIATGIHNITGIPILTNILHHRRNTKTLTRQGIYERWLTTHNGISVTHGDILQNKHVLIVDDVVTTGASLLACAEALHQACNIRISLLTLAVTRLA